MVCKTCHKTLAQIDFSFCPFCGTVLDVNKDSFLYPAANLECWGFIDSKGNWKIEPEYEGLNIFVDGIALTFKDHSYGEKHIYINQANETIAEFKDSQLCSMSCDDFSEGIAQAKYYVKGKDGYYDKEKFKTCIFDLNGNEIKNEVDNDESR